MKTVFISILALAFSVSQVSAETRIGYVDVELALSESRAGAKAQKSYEKEVKEKRGELEKKQNKLTNLQEKYTDQKASLSDNAKVRRQEEIIALEKDLKRSLKDTQEELRRKNGVIVGGLLKKIRGVVSEVGKEGGYTVILEKRAQPVLYADDAIDLTDQVVKRFDKLEG